MRKLLFILIAVAMSGSLMAQKYVTKSGHIKFYSETPMETIQADNHQVNAAFDAEKGDLVFKVLMKSFEFEKALMQEHFNENYVESDTYPNALFKGQVVGYTSDMVSKNGEISVKVKGDLTIHGVTKNIEADGVLKIDGDKITANSKFNVNPADFNIKIPGAVVKNIAESIEVTVNAEMVKLAK